MLPFSTTAINGNSNAAVVVAGFCINQLPTFLLPALKPILRNILDATVILFYFFTNNVFPYKTLSLIRFYNLINQIDFEYNYLLIFLVDSNFIELSSSSYTIF